MGRGRAFACAARLNEFVGLCRGKGQMDDARGGGTTDPKAALAEDFEHAVIVAEHVGFEFGYSRLTCNPAQVFE